jgi:hypothetical protein
MEKYILLNSIKTIIFLQNQKGSLKRTLKKLSFDTKFKTICWGVGILDPNEFLNFSSLKCYNFWMDYFSAKQKYTYRIIFRLLSCPVIRFSEISVNFSGYVWACHILKVEPNVKKIYAKVGWKMMYIHKKFHQIRPIFSTWKLLINRPCR